MEVCGPREAAPSRSGWARKAAHQDHPQDHPGAKPCRLDLAGRDGRLNPCRLPCEAIPGSILIPGREVRVRRWANTLSA